MATATQLIFKIRFLQCKHLFFQFFAIFSFLPSDATRLFRFFSFSLGLMVCIFLKIWFEFVPSRSPLFSRNRSTIRPPKPKLQQQIWKLQCVEWIKFLVVCFCWWIWWKTNSFWSGRRNGKPKNTKRAKTAERKFSNFGGVLGSSVYRYSWRENVKCLSVGGFGWEKSVV